MQIAKPSNILSPYIKQYWSIHSSMGPLQTHSQRIVPSGMVELTFYCGDNPQLNGNNYFKDTMSITGQHDSFYDISVMGQTLIFAVTFKPLGAKLLLDVPFNHILNQNIPLKEFVNPWDAKLEDSLFASPNFKQQVSFIESYFLAKLKDRHNSIFNEQRINSAIQKIDTAWQKCSITSLASLTCLSRKQFERTFQQNIGLSPKQFIRIVRFQHALYLKQLYPDNLLTSLAHQSGYYDQAHMINDFKMLTGLAPGKYFNQCQPYSDYFS